MASRHCLLLALGVILSIHYSASSNTVRTKSSHAKRSPAVNNASFARNHTIKNATSQNVFVTPKQAEKTENATTEKRGISGRYLQYYLQGKGCQVQEERDDRDPTASVFSHKNDCPLKSFMDAVRQVTRGDEIDIYEKTKKTIDPKSFYIPRGSWLQLYSRSYSDLCQTSVVNKDTIILNKKLKLNKNGRFVFVFEADKNDRANDFFQIGARDNPGLFADSIPGNFECNFFIKRGDNNDYPFKFSLKEKTVQTQEFKRLIDYNESWPLVQKRFSAFRRSLSSADGSVENEGEEAEVSRYVTNAVYSGTINGYISDDGLWQFYLPKSSIHFRNGIARRDLTSNADNHIMCCSNSAFEGSFDVSCANILTINEAKVPLFIFTQVQRNVLRQCGFYQSNSIVLLSWTKIGLPSFNVDPSENLDAFIKTNKWGDRGVLDEAYYIPDGTNVRMAVENNALDNLMINRRKYIKVFFDINAKQENAIITAKPALNCTCKTLEKILPNGQLKRDICQIVGENVFSFESMKIDKYGSITLKLGGAEEMVLIDENSKVKNTKFEFIEKRQNRGRIEMSGQGQEKICGTKAKLGMRRLGNTNKGFITGEMPLFSSEDLENTCKLNYISRTIKHNYPCLKMFALSKLVFSFIFESRDSYFEFDTTIGGQELKGQIVNCNIRNTGSLALTQSNAFFADFMRAMYKDEQIDMGPMPLKCSRIISCFQNDGRFWDKYNGYEEKEVIGASVAKYFREVRRTQIQANDVLIHCQNIIFDCPEGTLGRACRTMAKGFEVDKESKLLATDCYGKLEKDGFSLDCIIHRPFKLVDEMTIEGSDSDPLILQIEVRWRTNAGKKEYTVTSQLRGFFCTRQSPRQEGLYVYCKVQKDGLYYSIPQPRTSVDATFLNMDTVDETVVRAWTYRLSEKLEYIQMNSDLKICGNVIQARPGKTEQYIYADKSKNKYFICDHPSKVYRIDEVYKHRGINAEGSFLKGCSLTEVCFAGYQGRGIWIIKELGLHIGPGSWLLGKATCSTYDERMPKKNSGPIDVKIKLDGGKLIEYLAMEPVLVDERINRKENTVDYAFSMCRDNKTSIRGPYIFMEYAGNKMLSGGLDGFVRSVGYEGQAILKIETLSPLKVTLDTTRKSKNGGPSGEAQFVAGFQLRGTLKGSPTYKDSKVEFRLDVNTIRSTCKNRYRNKMVEVKKKLRDGLKNNSKAYEKITDRIAPYETRRKAAVKRVNILTQNIINYQREQRLSENFLQSKCSQDCNLVQTPGFKWTDNCALSKRIANASCISFARDAHLAGDVNCVAKCEIQKAQTRQEIQKKARDAKLQVREASDESDFSSVLQELADKTGVDLKVLKRVVDKEADYIKIIDKMWKELDITNVETDGWVDLRKVTKPFMAKLKCTVANKWTKKFEIAVDGKLADAIVDFYIGKRDGQQIDSMKSEIFEAIIKQELLDNSIDVWKKRNKELVEFFDSRKRFEIPKERLDREEPIMNDPHMSSMYSPKEVHNDAMVKTFSPWHVLKKNDPIKTMATEKKSPSKREKIVYRNDCHATRSKINEFSDMVSYMKTWTRAYDAGKTLEPIMKRNIDEGLRNMSFIKVQQKRSATEKPSKRDILANQWSSTLHSGFTEWGREFSRQLAAVNTMGPRIIKDELSAMFVTSPQETLESYIEASSYQADVAFKRSFVSKNRPFGEIAKNFINHLQSDKTLEELSPLVSDWDNMIRNVAKRTISCHSEL